MSAEEHINRRIGETTPSEDVGLSKFLAKPIFEATPEPQTIRQAYSRMPQPPSGLEDFAVNLQQGLNNYLTVEIQMELDRTRENAESRAFELEKKAFAIQKLKEIKDKERAIEEAIIKETYCVLDEFKIADRLRYIQKAVWVGKGKLLPFKYDHLHGFKVLGGFQLAHEYPSCENELVWLADYDSPGLPFRYRFRSTPSVEGTNLSIILVRIRNSDSKEGFKKAEGSLLISSSVLNSHSVISITDKEALQKLELALIEESGYRISHHLLPSQLEKIAKERLTEAQYSDGWNKWVIKTRSSR